MAVTLAEPLNRTNPAIPTRAHIAAELKKLDKKLTKEEKKTKIKDYLVLAGCSFEIQNKILDDLPSYPADHA